MKELSFEQCYLVEAGAGTSITGALFNGISSIINGISDFFSTIAGITFMFMNGTNSVKGSYKLHNFSTTWDNSDKVKAEAKAEEKPVYNDLIIF